MYIKWRTDIYDWAKISEAQALLFLSLSEKRLDETVETAKLITSKNDKLLTINISLIILIIGYLINHFNEITIDIMATTGLVALIILVYAGIKFIKNLFSYEIGTKGEEPKVILNSTFVNDGINSKESYKAISLQVCEAYQAKIDSNHLVNNDRSVNLQKGIYAMIILPLSFIISSLFLWFH
ncbi:hypothetical protein ACFLSX_00615 [Calditrichota bacterium]